jgi:hypothetical protein
VAIIAKRWNAMSHANLAHSAVCKNPVRLNARTREFAPCGAPTVSHCAVLLVRALVEEPSWPRSDSRVFASFREFSRVFAGIPVTSFGPTTELSTLYGNSAMQLFTTGGDGQSRRRRNQLFNAKTRENAPLCTRDPNTSENLEKNEKLLN